ncbi:MAG: ATP-binding protein [Thiobacillaceae bacterium]|nr:ATP-binding protein [Thiobacillaceae bacterium]
MPHIEPARRVPLGLNLLPLAAVLLILTGALIWTSWQRIEDFRVQERRNAELMVNGAAKEIAAELQGLRRAIGFFAAKEAALLDRFAADPTNEAVYTELERRVHAMFPETFAVTLADAAGRPLHTDVEGLVGESCQADIARFIANRGSVDTYIHPSPVTYHFDIMVPDPRPDRAAWVFFVSFRPDVPARVLGNSRIHGHELVLLREDVRGLIEVGARGARDRLNREFNLSPEELGRILATQSIEGTRWRVADLPDARLFSDFERRTWGQTGVLLAVLALISALIFRHLILAARRQADYTAMLEHSTEQLRESSGRIQAIVDTVVDGIITLNEAGHIESFNPAAERIFGYAAREVMGHDMAMLMPEPYRTSDILQDGESRMAGGLREAQGLAKDGRVFPMELAVSEMRLEGQRIHTAVVRDISRRRRLEQVKNEFVSTVSHELRTPLTAIRGALGLLAGGAVGALDEKPQELVKISLRNCERLVQLINDILDMDKIESGRMDFDLQQVDLHALVRQAIESADHYAAQYGVRVVLGETMADAWVRADPHRLMQVLMNLLSNAAKFSPPDGTVTVGIDSPRPGWARVSVRDQGPGVPMAFREQIFEKFAQADASDARRKGGTGLGLSISKAIVGQMGGGIGFKSPPGEGATFHFELPLEAPPGTGVTAATGHA